MQARAKIPLIKLEGIYLEPFKTLFVFSQETLELIFWFEIL